MRTEGSKKGSAGGGVAGEIGGGCSMSKAVTVAPAGRVKLGSLFMV